MENMDVFIEKKDEVIFVESKFSESYPQKEAQIPDAYWLNKGIAKSTDGKQFLNSELKDRYYGKEEIAKTFVELIKETYKLLESASADDKCWMDFGQEIKHLVGIVLTLSLGKQKYANKDIKFYNVYYDFKDKTYSYIDEFFELAQEKVGNLLVGNKLGKSFSYGHMTAQELVKQKTILEFDPERKAFASNQKIRDILREEFDFDPWEQNDTE